MSFICHYIWQSSEICGSYMPTFSMKIVHNATLNTTIFIFTCFLILICNNTITWLYLIKLRIWEYIFKWIVLENISCNMVTYIITCRHLFSMLKNHCKFPVNTHICDNLLILIIEIHVYEWFNFFVFFPYYNVITVFINFFFSSFFHKFSLSLTYIQTTSYCAIKLICMF